MSFFDRPEFSASELVSLLGLAQCVYLLVYLALRAGNVRQAILPGFYFLALGCAFFLDFAERFVGQAISSYFIFQWIAWFSAPLFSALLIRQIGLPSEDRKNRIPALAAIFLLPVAFAAAGILARLHGQCDAEMTGCADFRSWLSITGVCAAAIGMALIWVGGNPLARLLSQKDRAGKDRLWLALTLVFANLFFLTVMLASLAPLPDVQAVYTIRTVLGLLFVYLSGTSLFRIFPQAVEIVDRHPRALSPDEMGMIEKIEKLLDMDKVYHEPAYSRTDLARELNLPETVVSRIINHYFKKSFPRILNERRVEDAKRLLTETDAPIKVIAQEVGFNSLTSFNRVFRDLAGQTPGEYRERDAGITSQTRNPMIL